MKLISIEITVVCRRVAFAATKQTLKFQRQGRNLEKLDGDQVFQVNYGNSRMAQGTEKILT